MFYLLHGYRPDIGHSGIVNLYLILNPVSFNYFNNVVDKGQPAYIVQF